MRIIDHRKGNAAVDCLAAQGRKNGPPGADRLGH
jgi:hypothetical protein